MTTITTSRFALPLLAAGQADKELTHNEALACLDILLQPVVQAVGLTVPPVLSMLSMVTGVPQVVPLGSVARTNLKLLFVSS